MDIEGAKHVEAGKKLPSLLDISISVWCGRSKLMEAWLGTQPEPNKINTKLCEGMLRQIKELKEELSRYTQ